MGRVLIVGLDGATFDLIRGGRALIAGGGAKSDTSHRDGGREEREANV